MKIKPSIGDHIFNNINHFVLILLMLVTLYPFVYVVFASISDPIAIMQHKGLLIYPKGFQFEAYKIVINTPMISISYANTIFYLIAGTFINILLSTMGAYVLSREHFLLKNHIMFFISFTMFFHGGLIPNYLLVRNIGISDTVWALLLPRAISAWNLIIMRTGFKSIPASLEESARLDGARDITIMIRIIMPLSLPVISVMVLFYGVYHWNAWFDAMVYLRRRTLFPLQLILREILIGASQMEMLSDVSDNLKRPGLESLVKYATIMVATIPILCVYPFLQKYFVKGVMIGAIKA